MNQLFDVFPLVGQLLHILIDEIDFKQGGIKLHLNAALHIVPHVVEVIDEILELLADAVIVSLSLFLHLLLGCLIAPSAR